MAKKKADYIAEAKVLGIKVDSKDTIEVLKQKIADAKQTEKPALAKAGKRSAKGVKETEEKLKKELRKKGELKNDQPPEAKKGPMPVTRSKIERRSKKYREAAKLIDKGKAYAPEEAAELAVRTALAGFDASIELHVKLNVDPKQADQNIRDTFVLPHGSGKSPRVAVLAPKKDHSKLKSAGADIVGDDNLLEDIGKGKLDFDVLIATPADMPKLGRFAKLLGPKGLMPNPKSGTVTADPLSVLRKIKLGQVEYRVDQHGVVHLAIGKVSFGGKKILENLNAAITSIKAAKPASVKGAYIETVYLATTMGPSIKVAI